MVDPYANSLNAQCNRPTATYTDSGLGQAPWVLLDSIALRATSTQSLRYDRRTLWAASMLFSCAEVGLRAIRGWFARIVRTHRKNDLNPAILLPAGLGVVGSHGVRFTEALRL